MQVVPFPTRRVRAHYRHTLRTLNYVTLGTANGGIIRNLNSRGLAMQALSGLLPQQQMRLRFDLRSPRLHVETEGQVIWANPSGECGMEFVNLPARMAQQIDEWIFCNLLDIADRHAGAMFTSLMSPFAGEESTPKDGLILSADARAPIRLGPSYARTNRDSDFLRRQEGSAKVDAVVQSDWLSRPLSWRTLAWLIDSLLVLAAILLFAFVFISMTHELPSWPLTLGATFATAVVIAAGYRLLFALFGGGTLGGRLAQIVREPEREKDAEAGRFR
jgi:hypothetical protein